MTNERINELDRLTYDTLEEYRLLGMRADTLAFWHGVKAVVDELKMEAKTSEKMARRSSTINRMVRSARAKACVLVWLTH